MKKKIGLNIETRNKLIKWIFENHDHHENNDCCEGDYPYVNSKELERFIISLCSEDDVLRINNNNN